MADRQEWLRSPVALGAHPFGSEPKTPAPHRSADPKFGGLRPRIGTGREAHVETADPAPPRASALHKLGMHIFQDENFARQLRNDAERALAGVAYLTDGEKRQLIAGIDHTAWNELAEASDKYKVAIGRAALGIPEGVGPKGKPTPTGDPGGGPIGDDDGQGAGGFQDPTLDWGGEDRPRPGGAWTGPGGLLSGGGGRNVGDKPGRGDASDPKGPGGASLPHKNVGSYNDLQWRGLEAGFSGGKLPSRAVLAGGAWRALHPGRDVTDDPNPPPPPQGTVILGKAKPPEPITADWEAEEKTKRADDLAEEKERGNNLAEFGLKTGGLTVLGILGGGAAGGIPGAIALGLVGAAMGGVIEYAERQKHPGRRFWNPNPEDPSGGGWGGPRASVDRTAHGVEAARAASRFGQEAMPNLEGTGGTGPSGPRARASRGGLRSEAMPNPEGTGPVGPRSRARGREFGEALPNPEDPGGGGPVGPAT